MSVKMKTKQRKVFVGSFCPVTVTIDPASGLTAEIRP